MLESIFNKIIWMKNLKKNTPTQVFSFEYCKIIKSICLYKTLPVARIKYLKLIRGCSYGGRLVRLGLISTSLRNSYKNIMCSSEKWASRLGGISLDFAGIRLRWDENFPYETRKWASPARWDRIFINQFCFPLQMLIKWYKNICSAW